MRNDTVEPEEQAKRVLSLDGGGVRGIISLAFLERIDAVSRAEDPDKRTALCDRFDLVGGTSTGAVIGTALALGIPLSEIKTFYFRLASRVFRRSRWRLPGLQTLFDATALRQEIARVIGERTLDTPDLRTALAIVTKRMDTGSAWIVTNNPRSKYWEDPPNGAYIGNRHYRLASLVRASTAAPFYFTPEPIAVTETAPPGLFVDGGVSPHNNPALALFQVVTIPAYGFSWVPGADNLHILSVGTGRYRPALHPQTARRMTALGLATRALLSIGADCNSQVLTLMQILGRTDTPWKINTEIEDVSGLQLAPDPLFTFQRYDVELRQEWLRSELGIALSDSRLEQLRRMDEPANVSLLYEIGQAAAERFVRLEHLGAA